MAIGKAVAHLCLALLIRELKINVEHNRVVITLINIIFSVARAQATSIKGRISAREVFGHSESRSR